MREKVSNLCTLAFVTMTCWMLGSVTSSRHCRLTPLVWHENSYFLSWTCGRIDREFALFYVDLFDWEYGSIYSFDNVINVFHKIHSLNSFRTQIDNKQEINLKLEDIFIIIGKVYIGEILQM
jgi:hypothetical protein